MFRNSFFSRLFFSISCLLACLSLILPVAAQFGTQEEKPAACKELPPKMDFYRLSDMRSGLQAEVSVLEGQVKDLNDVKIPTTIRATNDLAETNKQLDKLNAIVNKSPSDQKQLEVLTSAKAQIENYLNGKTIEMNQQDLKRAEDSLSWKKAQLGCINNDLSSYTVTPEQNFKLWMSGAFAGLLAIVFIGFFVLAIIDEQVRRAVFSGQVGLQFLALFSIVIAIILFGITTILEAKELAALLGSLAGYILGRATASRDDGDKAKKPNPMDAFAGIDIKPAKLSLAVGATNNSLQAIPLDKQKNPINPAPNEFVPQWVSDDPNVAKVDEKGAVTGVSAGKCNVTATFKGVKSDSCLVTVT